MTRSEQINELATALAKAQAEIEGASKSRTNPAFKSQYATLADVWDACRGPLTKNGLSIVQLPGFADGKVRVTTILMHASGQFIEETLDLPVSKNDAQGVGSALTYGRRYGLSAMTGVAPDDDDDGSSASRRDGLGGSNGNGQRPQSRMQNASEPRGEPRGEQRSGTRVIYKRDDQRDPTDRNAP